MSRVLVPRAAPGFSALGLVSADHVVDATRGLLADWREIDVERLDSLARDLEASARSELDRADVPRDRQALRWALNLVYPGQTFDHAIPVTYSSATALTRDDIRTCVEEFHRQNEEARLIEARAQEPMVRGIRLTATGVVDPPAQVHLDAVGALPPAKTFRRVHTGDAWHDDVPVYDAGTIGPGPTLIGPAIVQYPFTTLLLRAGDTARMLANGDMLVDVA